MRPTEGGALGDDALDQALPTLSAGARPGAAQEERPRTIPALLAARQPKPRKLPRMREAGTPAEND